MLRHSFFAALLCAVLLCPAFAADATADAGLVARWTFDNDTATEIKNAVADRFHAQSPREFPHVDGIFGKAIDLSGSYALEVSKDIIPAGTRQITFSAWVAPRTLSGYREIFRKEDAGRHGTNRLLFSFQNDGRFLTLGLNTGGNYVECDAVIAPEEFLDGKWHFIAATYDGKTMRVYADGAEIGSWRRHADLVTGADFAPLMVGRDNVAHANFQSLEAVTIHAPAYIGSSTGTGEFFDGQMDDLRFYTRALTADELHALYTEQPAVEGDSVEDAITQVQRMLKRDPSDRMGIATLFATQLYVPKDTFRETLLATFARVAEAKDINRPTLVALQRLLRADFPEEVNTYITRWQANPVERMTAGADALMGVAKNLAPLYFEYLPATEMQWENLPGDDRAKWERVREIEKLYDAQRAKAGKALDAAALYEIVYEMEHNTHLRPHTSERVAGFMIPQTPPVADRTDAETQACLENDWLFQCDGKPTVARALQEITWSRELAARIEKQYPGKVDFTAQREILTKLEADATAISDKETEDKALYFAVRAAKRDITFKNPVLDFDSILYVDGPTPQGNEWNHETRHRLGYMAVPGARLMTLKGLTPGGKQTKLMPEEPLHGAFWRPDLSYDGKRVIVSFKPHNEKAFNLYEINVDGTGLRQITGGIFDDFDPVYLPDGEHIMFLTTRGHIYVRCMPPTNAFVMARMRLDGKDGLYIISRNGEPEYTPSVMQDGRVIYTRWEYTDKPLWRCQSLWTMNPDGTQVQTFWGNQSVWPDLLKDARQIPGTERVMFTGSAHHNWFSGSVGIIDPGKGFNFPDGMTKVTQELAWPESGNGPVDPKESENYHTAGKYRAYYSPYPLSEKDFMASAQRDGKFVLMLMDTDGNRELIFEGAHHIWDAQPLRARAVPPQLPDRVDWPTWADRDTPGTGVIYSNNVYDNAPEALRGKAKYLRIWSIEHKTYTYWHKRNYVSSGPEVSMVQSEGIKKIIGTVPIEDDGSVSFNAPTGIALHFQLLDENMRCLQTMRSFTGVLPGEVRGCLGCHESHVRTPVYARTGKALRRPASDITPMPWKDITVSYERYVQPVLDKYCAECHQNPKHKAYAKFNQTLRPGFLGFKEPYVTLTGSPTWGSRYRDNGEAFGGGFGWADTIMVEAFDQRDPVAYSTFPPMTKLSYRSRLINRMASGEHHGIKVPMDDLHRVILWVDAMCPYYGGEEVRAMEDPEFPGKEWLAQEPRIKSAPTIQRPGPFHPFETDEAYDCPPEAKFNELPPGVKK